jgi:ABC-2 type transport system permease protein
MVLHYAVQSMAITVRNLPFVLFTVALPVILYLLFAEIFGNSSQGSSAMTWRKIYMVSMAAYGSFGAAMSGGAQLAVERRSGWFRQLSVTSLPTKAFLWARASTIMVLTLPALILVYAAGFMVEGVRAPVTQWLATLGLMWLSLIPLTILGISIGMWLKAEAVQGLTTLLLLTLSLLGGLWIPPEAMPDTMLHIAKALPSYWLAQLGRYPFLGGSFPWLGVAVLAAWTFALTIFGALGYRRAVATSKR